jgi:hypothetical protein
MTALDTTALVGLQTVQRPAAPPPSQAHFSFHDLLEIVNPLQHIPVISTLYRWVTGDKIDTPDKIIGDTIYGGPTGFLASVADTVFESVTGKDVGDTVLAFLTGEDDDQPQVASVPAQVTPAQVTPAQATATIALPTPDVSALLQALTGSDIDSSTPARAASAYSRTMGLSAPQTLH